MKERPILFSAPMVRAIINSTKTQTRRIVKPQPEAGEKFFSLDIALNMYGEPSGLAAWFLDSNEGGLPPVFCPYGQPGDRLWVRETFMHEPADYCWEASVSIPCRPASTVYRADFPDSVPGEGWKPSIHMPRNLSRITLEVTRVRVERLQDISEADCVAEGISISSAARRSDACYGIYECLMPDGKTNFNDSAYALYRRLWESINGPGSWEANPWVWCIEFRRVTSD